MAFRSPAPRAAVIAMARTMDGNARTTSTTRMSTSSTRPPAYPATAPTADPERLGQQDDAEGDRDRDARAVEDAGEVVPSRLVGAEGVVGPGGSSRFITSRSSGLVGRQPRAQGRPRGPRPPRRSRRPGARCSRRRRVIAGPARRRRPRPWTDDRWAAGTVRGSLARGCGGRGRRRGGRRPGSRRCR